MRHSLRQEAAKDKSSDGGIICRAFTTRPVGSVARRARRWLDSHRQLAINRSRPKSPLFHEASAPAHALSENTPEPCRAACRCHGRACPLRRRARALVDRRRFVERRLKRRPFLRRAKQSSNWQRLAAVPQEKLSLPLREFRGEFSNFMHQRNEVGGVERKQSSASSTSRGTWRNSTRSAQASAMCPRFRRM